MPVLFFHFPQFSTIHKKKRLAIGLAHLTPLHFSRAPSKTSRLRTRSSWHPSFFRFVRALQPLPMHVFGSSHSNAFAITGMRRALLSQNTVRVIFPRSGGSVGGTPVMKTDSSTTFLTLRTLVASFVSCCLFLSHTSHSRLVRTHFFVGATACLFVSLFFFFGNIPENETRYNSGTSIGIHLRKCTSARDE